MFSLPPRVSVALVALLLTGCVGKQVHTELENRLDSEVSALNLRIAAEQAKARECSERERVVSAELLTSRKESERTAVEIAALKERQGQLLAELEGKGKLESTLVQMQQALTDLDRRNAQAQARVATYQELLKRFQKLIDAGTLRVKLADGRMVVELSSDVLFESGSAGLSKDGASAVGEVAGVLAGLSDRRYQIEGHTDSVPIATAQFPSNWELASARALTVVRTMVAAGLSPEQVSAASYGEFRPAAPNDTAEGKASNRRIEIVVVPDLSDLPGFDELMKASQPAP